MQSQKPLRRLLALALFGAAVSAYAQVITLSGVVLDVNTHREIRGVNITIKDEKLGTSSDMGGRYSLRLPSLDRKYVVVFRHVGYEPREIPIDALLTMKQVYLQPRVIQLPDVEVEAEGVGRMDIAKDLPQPVSVIDAKSFEIRGYVDAGDLLKTDHSVQVEEELSGKKTVSIRGGNPDEVVVMYNGVKMNNAYDNVSDLSLIDLEDIESFQVIKGSNTALYGPEAFSGVINIVPKTEQDYNLRFQQRVGTYRSGNWGLHFHQKLDALNLSYSFKQGGTQRKFVGDVEGDKSLENSSQHHTANLLYNLSPNSQGVPAKSLGVMFLNTSLTYDNQRDAETQSNLDQLLSFKYNGGLSVLKEMELTLSLRRQKEEIALADVFSRDIEDRNLQGNVEKRMQFGKIEWLLGYQLQQDDLHFRDDDSPAMRRRHHGFISIAKLQNATGESSSSRFDIDMSLRHDRLRDEQLQVILPAVSNNIDQSVTLNEFRENNWNETTFKMAFTLSGSKKDLAYSSSMSFGGNVKFPTLFQQVSAPDLLTSDRFTPRLQPEKNNSLELSANVSRDVRGKSAIYGWAVSGNYFQNNYTNKFREFSIPGLAFALYDNSPDARISGFEATTSLFLFRKKLTVSTGLSRYFISEKVAFAFKADLKRTLNVLIDHAGYSFQLHWFKEGEQAGVIRQQKPEGGSEVRFAEVILPAYSNLDLHLSKSFTIGKLKLFGNASARNLLNAEEVVLEGIAIRDRRYYLTFGAQY